VAACTCARAAQSYDDSELATLVRTLKVPARFAGCRAAFSVEKRSFTFQHCQSPQAETFWVIRDGERYVGVVPFEGFHGGTIYLLTHDPARAPKTLPMPTERWHIDTAIGHALRTDQSLPTKGWNGGEASTWTVGDGGRTLTLSRTYKGEVNKKEWEDKKQGFVDTANTFVLHVDPHLGYVVDATWNNHERPARQRSEYCSLHPPGLSNPWPGAEPGSHGVVCPTKAPGCVGYALNFLDAASLDPRLATCRDGGFVAFLNRITGWSPAMSLEGGSSTCGRCGVHQDMDLAVFWPEDLKPDADGLYRFTMRMRQCWLPPEVTEYVFRKMDVFKESEPRYVMLPLGRPVGFENQPYFNTEPVHGMLFPGRPVISTAEAHSGRKSLEVRGHAWPNRPQVVLRPGAHHRLTAWMKVVPATAEQKAALRARWESSVARDRKKHDQLAANLRKEGKEAEVPQRVESAYQEPGPAEGYVAAHYHEWTPHPYGKQWVEEHYSERVKEGTGWQRLQMEFTAPKWGPFIDVSFFCTNGGTAYLDDFEFARIDTAQAGRREESPSAKDGRRP
jgi:hypothetical protein